MKNKLQNLLKHKLQWLMLLAALFGVSQGVWGASTTIYVKKSGLFASNNPHIHYWGDGSTNWPGTKLTNTTTGAGGTWYYITIQSSIPNLILHDNSGNQTSDISRGDNTWYTVDSNKNYNAYTSDPDIVVLYLRGIGDWDADNDNLMSESSGVYTITKSLTADNGVEFKICGSSWGDHEFGKGTGNPSCGSNYTMGNNGNNVSFTPTTSGTHTFTFTLSSGVLNITCPAPSCTTPVTKPVISAGSSSITLDASSKTTSLSISSGDTGDTYLWSIESNPNSGASLNSTIVASPTVTFTKPGTYTFKVGVKCSSDANYLYSDEKSVTVSARDMYIKHNWGGVLDPWTWQKMTWNQSLMAWTYSGSYSGTSCGSCPGCNINTSDSDGGSWYDGNTVTVVNSPSQGDECIYKFTPKSSDYSATDGGAVVITGSVKYTITGAVNGGTGGSISPTSVAAIEGQTVTFTATPSSGYSVVKWNDGSDHVTTATTFDYTVGTSAQTVTVYFQCNAPSVTPGYETSTAQTICEGETALSLSVTESGYVSSRKWQRKGTGLSDDWGDISSSSSTTYNVPNDAASSYYYRYVATGCATTTSVSSSLYTVNANPSTPSITSYDEYVCSGAAPTFTFSSTSGLTYQMYVGGSTSGDDITGDGSSQTLTAGTITSATTFNLRATDANGCYASSADAAVGITPDMALTSITLSPSTICAGGESTVTANGLVLGGGSVAYTSSATAKATVAKVSDSEATITGVAVGNSTITATLSGGCGSDVSQTATITVSAGPETYTLSAAGGTTICSSGGKLRLSGSESGFSYQLYKNGSAYGSPVAGTGSAIEFDVFESGDYVCRAYLTSSPSCYTVMTGEVTLHISLTPTLIPATPTVTSYTPVTITSINTDILTWEISGEGNTAYLYDKTSNTVKVKASAAGSPYTITATTSGGCSQTATLTVNADVEVCD